MTRRLLAALLLLPLLPAPASAQHDKTFWLALAEKRFVVPEGASVDALARELSALLRSPDPVLRDDVAYSGLVTWIFRQRAVSDATRHALTDEWLGNLTTGIGESGTDTVFGRSFSALALGIIVGLDNETPGLDRAGFDGILTGATTYLGAERDVRGYDVTKGWMHSVAHTADLLKFLGRSRHLDAAGQAAILTAIAAKLGSVDEVLTHGEDERLARAVLSIAARPDLDTAAFAAWLTSLGPVRPTGPPTPTSMAQAQNRKHLVVSLHAVLTSDARDTPSLAAAREAVRVALKRFVP